MRTLLSIVLCLGLVGCSSPTSSGWKFYNPTTWFSGSAGRASAKVEEKIDKAQDKASVEAQKSAHVTQLALMTAPQSRQVDVARNSNDNTVALLDQMNGGLSADVINALKEQVRLLTSDLAEERARGEAQRLESQKKVDSVSKELTELAALKKKTDAALATSFERENALANELRNERWWSWFYRIAGVTLVILIGAAYLYVRLTIGGLPTALTGALADLRQSAPDVAEKLTSVLDIHTTRSEQALIRALLAKRK